MKFLIGKKLNMTQVWRKDRVIAVTQVLAGPCRVTQLKTEEKDGYGAIQIGFGDRRKKNIKKPQLKHMEKAGGNFAYLREFTFNNKQESNKIDNLKIGDQIDVSTFLPGDKIQVTGVSKGKGFQGVVKRHGFAGQTKTHGNKDQLRMPGSIGATGPAHVFKGMRMPGRMGGDKVTVKTLEIIAVDQENNILSIKGAIPGARNGLILVSGDGELKFESKKVEIKEVEKKEKKVEVKKENKSDNLNNNEVKVEVKKDEKKTEVKKEDVVKDNKENK